MYMQRTYDLLMQPIGDVSSEGALLAKLLDTLGKFESLNAHAKARDRDPSRPSMF